MHADSIHANPDVALRLGHLYKLHRKDIDLRLGDTPYETLLARLGNPHTKLPPVVHVAGTNGKGSTIAFLRSILEAAGYKVHAYTSPHLLRFNERIRLGGTLISDAALIALYDQVMAANGDNPVTFFEFTTAMAFTAFAQNPADIVLLETGMGGRLDCSNVIEEPVVTVITKISYDHTEFLGHTLPEIAAEKAGIIKPAVPCILGPQMDLDAVLPVFTAKAVEQNAPLLLAGRDWPLVLPAEPSLVGAHQHENAATALAAITQLQKSGFTISESAIIQGLTHTDWPGRMQHITTGPIAGQLPPGWQLWFDGAHNDSGAMALATQLKTWKEEDPDRSIHLIVAMSAGKDAETFFKTISGTYNTVTLLDLPAAQKPQTASDLHSQIKNLFLTECYEKSSIPEAVKNIAKQSKTGGDYIVVCGSLYLYAGIFDRSDLDGENAR